MNNEHRTVNLVNLVPIYYFGIEWDESTPTNITNL